MFVCIMDAASKQSSSSSDDESEVESSEICAPKWPHTTLSEKRTNVAVERAGYKRSVDCNVSKLEYTSQHQFVDSCV